MSVEATKVADLQAQVRDLSARLDKQLEKERRLRAQAGGGEEEEPGLMATSRGPVRTDASGGLGVGGSPAPTCSGTPLGLVDGPLPTARVVPSPTLFCTGGGCACTGC